MEKAHLVAQPFQLIARTKREAYQWSGSGGRGKRMELADEGDAIPPEGRSPLHPLAFKRSAIVVLSVSKGESGTELQNVSCCMQGPGETGETWTYPSMVLVPLCTAMVMAWSCKEN